MRAPAFLVGSIAVALFLLVMAPGGALADTVDGRPKILLHVSTATAKAECATGQLADCRAGVPNGLVNLPLIVYVLAARGDQLEGLAGVQFGIDYFGQYDPAGATTNLNIFSWTLCATIEFATPEPLWPSPGSANLITWRADEACQTGEVGVAGFFYLTAYATSQMFIRQRPSDGEAKVADCGAQEIILSPFTDLGCAYFTPEGFPGGCNPCVHPCGVDPVESSTWSRIKAR